MCAPLGSRELASSWEGCRLRCQDPKFGKSGKSPSGGNKVDKPTGKWRRGIKMGQLGKEQMLQGSAVLSKALLALFCARETEVFYHGMVSPQEPGGDEGQSHELKYVLCGRTKGERIWWPRCRQLLLCLVFFYHLLGCTSFTTELLCALFYQFFTSPSLS